MALKDGYLHDGIDIGWQTKIPYVIASRDGKVVATEDGHADYDNQGYGNYVTVDHGDGFEVLYGHLASGSLKVKVGDSVTYGQVLGTMGASGHSTGPHLHFRMHLNGEPVDPLDYLDPNNPRPMSSGGSGSLFDTDDFCVHTGKSDPCLVLNKSQMQKAINNLNWGSEAKANLKSALDGFVGIQTKYKVNGVFAMAVTMIESGCGTGWAAIDKSTYNWMSISGSYKGQSYYSNRAWRKYSSFTEATYDFGDLIANSSYYFKAGKYTVKTIAIPYCDASWGEYVNKYMKDIYKAAGVSLTPTARGGSSNILKVAEKMHTYFEKHGYVYDGVYAQTFEGSKKYKAVVCATYVSWVLQECGYIKDSEHYDNCGDEQDIFRKYKWTEIKVSDGSTNKLRPGDIIIYCYGSSRWHTDIYVGNGKKLNAGYTGAISGKHYDTWSLNGTQGTYSHYFIYRPKDAGNSSTSTSSSQFKTLLKKANISESTLNNKGAKQLIIVNSSGSSANVTFYEKNSSSWRQLSGYTCSGYVGSKGTTSSPKEGKAATPKGLYSVGEAFYQGNNPPSTKLNTFKITNNTYWVDDPNSSYYNKKYVGNNFSSIASSGERMWEISSYKYGFVINYNTSNPVKGAGSAIFFHISHNSPTAGCVSVSESMVLKYLGRLDKSKKPYILII